MCTERHAQFTMGGILSESRHIHNSFMTALIMLSDAPWQAAVKHYE